MCVCVCITFNLLQVIHDWLADQGGIQCVREGEGGREGGREGEER